MKKRGIARAESRWVNDRINVADRLAIGCRLLIGQSQVTGPHRCCKAGPAILIRRASLLVGANIESEISIGRYIRAVAISGRALVGRSDYTRKLLPRGDRDLIRRDAAAAVCPGRL